MRVVINNDINRAQCHGDESRQNQDVKEPKAGSKQTKEPENQAEYICDDEAERTKESRVVVWPVHLDVA